MVLEMAIAKGECDYRTALAVAVGTRDRWRTALSRPSRTVFHIGS
jgi:hypothetical protein